MDPQHLKEHWQEKRVFLVQRVEVDLRRVREELEMERMMDQHPGYDKKGRTLRRIPWKLDRTFE
jgi:hypothetical protein